ncbi:MAG: formylglycine-generating enzyme family protein [Nitrospinales bacterium]
MRLIIFSFLLIFLTMGCSSSPDKSKDVRAKPPSPGTNDKLLTPKSKRSQKHSLFKTDPKKIKSKQQAIEDQILAKKQSILSDPSDPDKNKIIHLPTLVNLKDQSIMVLVNEGNYLVGKPGKSGLHEIYLPSFYIDQYEITNKKFKAYNAVYTEKVFNKNIECYDCPATGIDWNSANKYCSWAGKRLPTEPEWEAAARGNTNHHWPWGDKWLPKYANSLTKEDGFEGISPVGSFPIGSSPSGALDMAGNVWEWVSPENSLRRKNKTVFYTAKGGSWKSSPKSTKISFRHKVETGLKNRTFGFRCAKSIQNKSN